MHSSCIACEKETDGHINHTKGANIAGFVKVTDAILAFGV